MPVETITGSFVSYSEIGHRKNGDTSISWFIVYEYSEAESLDFLRSCFFYGEGLRKWMKWFA